MRICPPQSVHGSRSVSGMTSSAGASSCLGGYAAATKDDLHAQMEFDDTSVVLVIGSEGITDPNIFERIMAGNV